MKQHGMGAAALLIAGLLVLTACGGTSSQTEQTASAEPASSLAGSSVAPPVASDPAPVEAQPTLVGSELGFSVELPPMLEGAISQETTTFEAPGGTITTLIIAYSGAGDTVNVMSFDEMSTAVWESVKAEGGPTGTELGTSEAGRVVVYHGLQSNPFAEGTEAFTLFQEFPSQAGEMMETFAFTA